MSITDDMLFSRDVGEHHFVGVYRFIYNDRLVFGDLRNEWCYERGFCFPQDGSAIEAAQSWDGEGDPEGPWIKEVGTDRYGPGSKAHQ